MARNSSSSCARFSPACRCTPTQSISPARRCVSLALPVNTVVSSHNTKAGWTAGGGLEGRLAGNWTAKIESLYLDLGTVTTIPAPTPGATTAVAFNSRVTDNVLRVGVNYKFDGNEIWAD